MIPHQWWHLSAEAWNYPNKYTTTRWCQWLPCPISFNNSSWFTRAAELGRTSIEFFSFESGWREEKAWKNTTSWLWKILISPYKHNWREQVLYSFPFVVSRFETHNHWQLSKLAFVPALLTRFSVIRWHIWLSTWASSFAPPGPICFLNWKIVKIQGDWKLGWYLELKFCCSHFESPVEDSYNAPEPFIKYQNLLVSYDLSFLLYIKLSRQHLWY